MTGDATQPSWNGYRLTVACACGVVFERWVCASGCRRRPDPLGSAELSKGDARLDRTVAKL